MTTHFVRSPLVRTNGVLYGDNSTLIHLCDVKFLPSIPIDTAPEFIWKLNLSIEKRMIGLSSASYNKSISYMLFFNLANTFYCPRKVLALRPRPE